MEKGLGEGVGRRRVEGPRHEIDLIVGGSDKNKTRPVCPLGRRRLRNLEASASGMEQRRGKK